MKQEMRTKFSDEVRTKAANLYGVNAADLHLLGNNQSYVYGYEKGGEAYILRISHSSHRSLEQIEAELNWIDFLHHNGMPVAVPVGSCAGHRIGIIVNKQDTFIVTAFIKAQGHPWSASISQNEEFTRLGKLAGKMHALAKKYKPLPTQPRRFTWYENEYLKYFIQNVSRVHPLIAENIQKLIEQIHLLPKSAASFGLIHGDFCFGNYSVQEDGTITIFDFDESQYGWFVQDIAVNLFYGVAVPSEREDQSTFARRYLACFLEGYAKENTIDRKLLWDQLPLFLDFRQAILYSSLHRNGDIENLDVWSKTFLERAENNMLNGLSIIDVEQLKI